MKNKYTIRRIFLSVLWGTLIVVCVCGCGKDTAYYMEGALSESECVYIEEETHVTEQENNRMLYVYICGAVNQSGVYTLPEGSRIIDLFAAAGGLTPEAAKEYWNQAQLLEDGAMIYVPTQKEADEQDAMKKGMDDGVSQDDLATTGKVNINTASKEQLMTIPGIGEAKADAIIAYRQNKGVFSAIEEIMQVEGIKSGVFEKIKNYIKVN